MKVLISQRAEDDLVRIYGYIVAGNPDPEAAERFKIDDAIILFPGRA